jgi:hypothetical protein
MCPPTVITISPLPPCKFNCTNSQTLYHKLYQVDGRAGHSESNKCSQAKRSSMGSAPVLCQSMAIGDSSRVPTVKTKSATVT